jgi:hypothetical protein
MHPSLESIRRDFPQLNDDYTPPWGLATRAEFERLTKLYGCKFPPTYMLYQTEYVAMIPIVDNGFAWATQDLEAPNLESTIVSARKWGVPEHLVPFWEDESNFYCFDTQRPSLDAEYPVVFWCHDEHRVLDVQHLRWPNFVSWVRQSLEDWQKRIT